MHRELWGSSRLWNHFEIRMFIAERYKHKHAFLANSSKYGQFTWICDAFHIRLGNRSSSCTLIAAALLNQ